MFHEAVADDLKTLLSWKRLSRSASSTIISYPSRSTSGVKICSGMRQDINARVPNRTPKRWNDRAAQGIAHCCADCRLSRTVGADHATPLGPLLHHLRIGGLATDDQV